MGLTAQQPLGPALGHLLTPKTHGHSSVPLAPRTPTVVFDATSLGSPLHLDRNWRVGITANPEAGATDFDDSAWALRDAGAGFADLPDLDHPAASDTTPNEGKKSIGQTGPPPGHKRPWVWFRLHLKLAPEHGPVALMVELPVTQTTNINSSTDPGVEIFANGQPIHPEGPNGVQPEYFQAISRIYDLNVPSSQTELTLVVRTIYLSPGPHAYDNFLKAHRFLLGNREDLDRSLELWTIHMLHERLPRLINAILCTGLALFLLALYYTQKGHVEYLWLALHELLQAPIGFVDLAGSFARIDHFWHAALVLQMFAISAYLYFEFLVSFLALRKRWYIHALRWSAIGLAGIAPMFLQTAVHGWIGVAVLAVFVYFGLWTVCWFVFVFGTLISATIRRNFEAGLLLIPLILTVVGSLEPTVTGQMEHMGGLPYSSPLTIQAGPIPIHFTAIGEFAGLAAILLIVFVRFLRVQRDQERVSNELAAARSVQELLIPQEKVQTPGFEVDSIYNPANEVGGDFFYVRPTSDGGLLLVIGDVAGKGLKAAMNVSMLMGALRSSSERRPAKVLESLNRVLTGSESFTTCQAAWFGADGELLLANAGHLPPYLNSQEVAIPGSLPLGVTAQVNYDELHLYLHPGDRLLLLSDGVVEARRPSGELFGFDRVHNLSNQSAFYIADAARSFGQEDDITVVTVRRLEQDPA
jgi:hypothetical protein